MKFGCVVQGDIRRGTSQILQELTQKFDLTILSTWVDDERNAPSGDYTLVVSDKPSVGGLSNRNYQRLSTSSGLRAAKEAGCDYVLKWRTDMLPTKLDLNQLYNWANYKIPSGVKSRLVTSAFRNLSVEQDCFSTIPDLFAFGHIEEMEMLWGDDNFDYSRKFNLPSNSVLQMDDNYPNVKELYCAESELYARYKENLERKLDINLYHSKILIDYFRLIDHRRLGILWFGKQRGFRCIAPAWEHKWWTESAWRTGNHHIVPPGYHVTGYCSKIRERLSPLKEFIDVSRQRLLWNFCIKNQYNNFN